MLNAHIRTRRKDARTLVEHHDTSLLLHSNRASKAAQGYVKRASARACCDVCDGAGQHASPRAQDVGPQVDRCEAVQVVAQGEGQER